MITSPKQVIIIDYKLGNTASVKKAFEKVGAKAKISNSKKEIEKAGYLVLPGVGAFGDGMKNLIELGLVELLTTQVVKKKTPFLGICLGMQLLAEEGCEFGEHAGLGWIKGKSIKLKSPRLPHIGWNNIKIIRQDIFREISDDNFYFVHSYILKPADRTIVSSTCNYGETFPSSIQKDNIFATQFHPEKSQRAGLKVLENFLNFKH